MRTAPSRHSRPSRLLLMALGPVLFGTTAGPDSSGVVLTDSSEASGPPVGTFDLSAVDSLGLADDEGHGFPVFDDVVRHHV